MRRAAAAVAMVLGLVVWSERGGVAQGQSRVPLRVQATAADDLRRWDGFVTARLRSGDLRLRRADRDPALPGRVVERLQQVHAGVPVWGAELVRDADAGVAQAIFGEFRDGLTVNTRPALDGDAAEARLLAVAGPGASLQKALSLVILPTDAGARLAYTAVVATDSDVVRVFVDADTGAELLRYSEIQTQAAVGTGRGVTGDTKKVSVRQQGGVFMADDQHRPPVLTTYDMRDNISRTILVAFGNGPLATADLATDSDNDWTDPSAVDAHAHIGWTYDYYYRRFGRRGLDNADRPIVTLINGLSQQAALSAPASIFGQFALNAFWCDSCGPGGVGVMYFGNGLPPGYFLVSSGNNYTHFAGALDIAAHELTHGVTSSTSGLIYQNESGALNEAFSDIMGTSVEFFFQPPGTGVGQADYLLGEDISRALRPGAINGDRSLENPAAYGDPDHYSRRYTGTADNGGVHSNSGIANHAFYLAIEGGTNRTSGLGVQGVGPANREQIERVFYRAFVFLLPANATFATARAATIQAARDLYGAGGAVERAITQAWTAVGVN